MRVSKEIAASEGLGKSAPGRVLQHCMAWIMTSFTGFTWNRILDFLTIDGSICSLLSTKQFDVVEMLQRLHIPRDMIQFDKSEANTNTCTLTWIAILCFHTNTLIIVGKDYIRMLVENKVSAFGHASTQTKRKKVKAGKLLVFSNRKETHLLWHDLINEKFEKAVHLDCYENIQIIAE